MTRPPEGRRGGQGAGLGRRALFFFLGLAAALPLIALSARQVPEREGSRRRYRAAPDPDRRDPEDLPGDRRGGPERAQRMTPPEPRQDEREPDRWTRRTLPVLLGILVGFPLLFAGKNLPDASVSGFAETDVLRLDASSRFTTAGIGARNLGISGLASIVLPDGERLEGDDLSLRIDDATGEDGFTSMPAFEIGADSRLVLAVDRNEGRLTLSFQVRDLALDLIPAPGARVLVDAEACEPSKCDFVFDRPPPLRITASAKTPLEIRFDLVDRTAVFTDRIAVSGIRFWELEQVPGKVEKRGGLLDGSIRFREAPDQAVRLDRGTVIDIEPIALVLRSIEIRKESVYCHFSGKITEVTIELGDSEVSLMPNWFHWLSNNPYAQLALGLASILLGAGYTIGYRRAYRR